MQGSCWDSQSDLGAHPNRLAAWVSYLDLRLVQGFGTFASTVDDVNPKVPLKGSARVPLRGSFEGSIGF